MVGRDGWDHAYDQRAMGVVRRVVLLRGVNVSGANKLPMAVFREMLAGLGLGLGHVETYIRSGNAVLESALAAPELERMIRDGIAARFGFTPETFVLGAGEIAAALVDHPFAAADPARVHVFFLKGQPVPDVAALQALAQPGDGWHLGDRRFTLHTPAGFGASKLAERLPRLLPMTMTARNLRTVAALHAMMTART
jgi:uncharacterized protein (DUF1697 family)